MRKANNKSEAEDLRRKAESLMKKKAPKTDSDTSETKSLWIKIQRFD